MEKKKKSVEAYLPMLGLLIVGLALGYFLAGHEAPSMTGACVLPNQTEVNLESLKNEVASYLTRNFLSIQGMNASARVDSINKEGSLYRINTSILVNGRVVQKAPVYVTEDGKQLLLGSVFNLSQDIPTPTATPEPTIEAKERPSVELFVMSHCPYGLQMMKAMVPVYELLHEKADIQLKFVSYTMHGEEEVEENTRMYCIGKEYGNDRQWAYVKCFANEGKSEACMQELEINETKIDECINTTYKDYEIDPAKTPYPIYAEENQRYGVRGSPTLVVNGVEAKVSRSPEAIKELICSAFTEAPEECNETLSEETASPGFGYGTGGGAGQCG